MVLAAILAVAVVYAYPGGATGANLNDEGAYLDESNDTIDVNGSHVYTYNLDSSVSTIRWAGITGNLSGNLVLGDDDEATMFSWVGEGLLVYTSISNTIAWGNLADAALGDVVGVYGHLATSATVADDYGDTFNESSEDISSNIFSLSSDHALTEDGTNARVWKTYSLTDGADIVFAGLAQTTGTETNYKNQGAEYQMIIPEDGTATNELTATTYYLWVELE